MRILHLATFLQGGAGRVITDLAIQQHRAGHDVTVVASELGPTGYGNYPCYLDELARCGTVVRLIDSMFERHHAANLAVVQALDELYRPGSEPQVIHAHAAVPSLVGLVFAGARRASLRIVQTMHGWGVVKTADQVATDVALLNLVDRVIVPSGHAAGTLASLGVSPSRISIVPYGVDKVTAEPDDRDLGLLAEMARWRQDGALVVVCTGTFGARKNQALLVEAAARTTGAPVFLTFVGDGDDREIREAIDRTATGERVRVHGFSPAARRIAAAADVLVLPSRSEGQPLAVLEAFADGTLAVVSDIPELAELVDDRATGFRFRSGSADSLARVLGGIAGMPLSTRRAVSERARARYLDQFTVSAMVGAYLAAYQAPLGAAGTDRRRREPPAA